MAGAGFGFPGLAEDDFQSGGQAILLAQSLVMLVQGVPRLSPTEAGRACAGQWPEAAQVLQQQRSMAMVSASSQSGQP